MANPKSRPNTQTIRPVNNKLCPSTPPKNLTADRSGNFRLASPPSCDWPKVGDANNINPASAEAGLSRWRKREPREACTRAFVLFLKNRLMIGAAAQKTSRLINEISDSSTLEIILSDSSKKWREYVCPRLRLNTLKQANSLPKCSPDTPEPTASAYRNGVLLPICVETVQRR